MKKCMNNRDDAILDVFSNEQTGMRPQFKRDLRNQVVARSAHYSGRAKRRNRWPAFVLVPAFGGLLLALLIGFNLHNPSDIKHPLTVQKVSAAELIKRSETHLAALDVSKYTYFTYTTSLRMGPHALVCGTGNDPYVGPEAYEYHTWLYKAPDKGVEAYYSTGTNGGIPASPLAVYDTSPQTILFANLYPQPVSIQDQLGIKTAGEIPTVLVVDAAGNQLSSQDVPMTNVNGREVYQFYTKLNPQSIRLDPAVAVCGENVIHKTVLDAQTYLLLESDEYIGTVSPATLHYALSTDYTYENLSQDQALRNMERAGFNKATALPQYPLGHD